jgi:hypothetical protein
MRLASSSVKSMDGWDESAVWALRNESGRKCGMNMLLGSNWDWGGGDGTDGGGDGR